LQLEFEDKKEELLDVILHDKKQAEMLHMEQGKKINIWDVSYNIGNTEDIDQYKNPSMDKQSKGSNIIAPISLQYIDQQIPGLKSAFLDTNKIIKSKAIRDVDSNIAKMIGMFLNFHYRKRFKHENFIDKLVRTYLIEGSVVVKLGWDYRKINKFEAIRTKRQIKKPIKNIEDMSDEDYRNYNKETVVEEKEVVKVSKKQRYHINQPIAEVLTHEEVMIAPNSNGDLEAADFVIVKYQSNISTLKEQGAYTNLDKIALNDNSSYDINDHLQERTIDFIDDSRKLIDIMEYWGYYDIDDDGINEPILCVIANGTTIIRLELNPFPDGKLPFAIAAMNKDRNGVYGESDIRYLDVIQKQATNIWRGAFNNMIRANNGQRGFPRGLLTKQDFSQMLAGNDYVYDPSMLGPAGIIKENFDELPGSFYNLLGMLKTEADQITGISPQNGHQTGYASMSTPSSAMSASQLKQLDHVRNLVINIMLPMFRKWTLYASAFMDEKEWARIVGPENFVNLPKDMELFDLVEIEFDIATQESNQKKMETLSYLFQTLAPVSPPEIQQRQQAKIFDLADMSEEADFMRNYEPEPDPMEKQMQQMQMQGMQLEMAKLQEEVNKIKAETTRTYVQAEEDKADIKRKIMEASLKESNKNLLNAKFIDQLQGKTAQFNLSKHMATLSSKERIEANKHKLHLAKFNLENTFKRDKLRFDKDKLYKDNEIKLEDINFKYKNMVNQLELQKEIMKNNSNSYGKLNPIVEEKDFVNFETYNEYDKKN
jgi:hypothetical protein